MKNYTDTLFEQTNTKPQETLEFKLNKQMQTFSISPSKYLCAEGKWLLTVTCFEANNSVLIITDGRNGFSTTEPGYWASR